MIGHCQWLGQWLGFVLLLAGGGAELALAASLQLAVEANVVTAEIVERPLGEVLREIGRQANLTVQIAADEASVPISMTLNRLSLQESLQRLLQDQSYVILTADASREATADLQLLRVTVLPQSGDRVLRTLSSRRVVEPTPDRQTPSPRSRDQEAEVPEATVALRRAVTEAATPTERAAALQQLMDEGDDHREVLALISSALEDEAPNVRALAVDLLADIEGPGAADRIAQVALYDLSVQLRIDALSKMLEFGRPALHEILPQALQDQNLRVRRHAQQLLKDYPLRPHLPEAESSDEQPSHS